MAATAEQQAAVDLASATRRLMLAAATTAVDVDQIHDAAVAMDRLSEQLSSHTRERILRIPFGVPARHDHGGPEEGWRVFATNPQSFPVAIHFDGDTATADMTSNALYEGPPGMVHGGFLSHLLDVMLGTLVQSRGMRGLTATLDLRYLAPTPLEEPLHLEARVLDVRGRRITTEGWIEHEGVRTVQAHGTFIDVGGATR